jgi:hypothetical protein
VRPNRVRASVCALVRVLQASLEQPKGKRRTRADEGSENNENAKADADDAEEAEEAPKKVRAAAPLRRCRFFRPPCPRPAGCEEGRSRQARGERVELCGRAAAHSTLAQRERAKPTREDGQAGQPAQEVRPSVADLGAGGNLTRAPRAAGIIPPTAQVATATGTLFFFAWVSRWTLDPSALV